jgi:hypothetical protein
MIFYLIERKVKIQHSVVKGKKSHIYYHHENVQADLLEVERHMNWAMKSPRTPHV